MADEDLKRGFTDVSSVEVNPSAYERLALEAQQDNYSDLMLQAMISDRRLQAVSSVFGFRPGDNMATLLAGSVLNSPMLSQFWGGSQVALQAGMQDAFRMSYGMGGKDQVAGSLATQVANAVQDRLFGNSMTTQYGMDRTMMGRTAAIFGSLGGMDQVMDSLRTHRFDSTDAGRQRVLDAMRDYRPETSTYKQLDAVYEDLKKFNLENPDQVRSVNMSLIDEDKAVKLVENFSKTISLAAKVMKTTDEARINQTLLQMSGGVNYALDADMDAQLRGRLARAAGAGIAQGQDTRAVLAGQLRMQSMLEATTGNRLYASVAAEGMYNRSKELVAMDQRVAGYGDSSFGTFQMMDLSSTMALSARMSAEAQTENPELAIAAYYVENMQPGERKRRTIEELKRISTIPDLEEQRRQMSDLMSGFEDYGDTYSSMYHMAGRALGAEGNRILGFMTEGAVMGHTAAQLEPLFARYGISKEAQGGITQLYNTVSAETIEKARQAGKAGEGRAQALAALFPTLSPEQLREIAATENKERIREIIKSAIPEDSVVQYGPELEAGLDAILSMDRMEFRNLHNTYLHSEMLKSDKNFSAEAAAAMKAWDNQRTAMKIEDWTSSEAGIGKANATRAFFHGLVTGESPPDRQAVLAYAANRDEYKDRFIKGLGARMVGGELVVDEGSILTKAGFKAGTLGAADSVAAMEYLQGRYKDHDLSFGSDGELLMSDRNIMDEVRKDLVERFSSGFLESDQGKRIKDMPDLAASSGALEKELRSYLFNSSGKLLERRLLDVVASVMDPETGKEYDLGVSAGLDAIRKDLYGDVASVDPDKLARRKERYEKRYGKDSGWFGDVEGRGYERDTESLQALTDALSLLTRNADPAVVAKELQTLNGNVEGLRNLLETEMRGE